MVLGSEVVIQALFGLLKAGVLVPFDTRTVPLVKFELPRE